MSEHKQEVTHADRMRELLGKLEAGVQSVFQSENYADYLRTMAKFHRYSINNSLLIHLQRPDSSLVAGYVAWQKQFERKVKRGEKGITIIAPSPYKQEREVEQEDGSLKKEEVIVQAYRPITVFDVSQTEGKELPSLGVKELSGDVEKYQDIFQAIHHISPVPITVEPINTGAKGFFSPLEERIAIKEGMEEAQTVKTGIHELAHSILHSKGQMKDAPKDSRTKEVEAESIAYVVCQHFGIDTSDYSFGYIAGWSSGKETPELKESLETIRSTSDTIIQKMEHELHRMAQEKIAVRDQKRLLRTEREIIQPEIQIQR